jgi:methylmalonyl-CoA mutase N-terminal domain/subunit
LDVDAFAPRLSFFFNSHNNLFEEIAKFRAARRIWAKIMRKQFYAKNPKSWMLRFHTQTAGCTLTAQEPQNNAIRVAYQALAAVLGGTQSLHTNSRDEALSLPTEESVKLALRTQQIIAYESHIPDVVDPLAGSYFVENLTNAIEHRVNKYLRTIDDMGGALACIENGYFQREIHDSAYEYQKAIERGDIDVVGVNKYSTESREYKISVHEVPPRVVKKQIQRLKRILKKRDGKGVASALRSLKRAAANNENVMNPIIACVKAYATVGEVSDTLREIFGEHKEKSIV